MKRLIRSVASRASTVSELFVFLWENRLWWIIPFVVVIVIFGVLIVFAQTSPVTPFMYALF